MAFGCVLIQEAFQSAGTVPSLVTHRAPAENSSGYRRICWGHDQGDSDLRGLDEPTHVQVICHGLWMLSSAAQCWGAVLNFWEPPHAVGCMVGPEGNTF